MEKWEAKTENNDIRLSMLGLRRKLHQFQSSLFLLGKKSHRKRSFLLLRRLFFSVQPQMESRGKCFGKSGKRTRRLCFVSGVPEILDVKAFQHQTLSLSLLLPRRIQRSKCAYNSNLDGKTLRNRPDFGSDGKVFKCRGNSYVKMASMDFSYIQGRETVTVIQVRYKCI